MNQEVTISNQARAAELHRSSDLGGWFGGFDAWVRNFSGLCGNRHTRIKRNECLVREIGWFCIWVLCLFVLCDDLLMNVRVGC